jgi:hypothetical protein
LGRSRRCGRDRDGTVVGARGAVAPAGVRFEGAQPHLPIPARRSHQALFLEYAQTAGSDSHAGGLSRAPMARPMWRDLERRSCRSIPIWSSPTMARSTG